ncbi:MAG: SRPBCC domain-containing protein [Acidobacteriota bacterium]
MPDILHRVGIAAPADRVYDALATTEGLSQWWVTRTTGNPRLGGILHFQPDAGGFKMQVADFQAGRLMRWKCIEGPDEWVGTEITFRIEARPEQTIVLFAHSGWKEPVEFMHHCSTKWATFLLSLKSWLERSEGRPFPYDMKIHVGD